MKATQVVPFLRYDVRRYCTSGQKWRNDKYENGCSRYYRKKEVVLNNSAAIDTACTSFYTILIPNYVDMSLYDSQSQSYDGNESNISSESSMHENGNRP